MPTLARIPPGPAPKYLRDGDRFGHTPASQLLRSDHPMSMRAFPRMLGLRIISQTFGNLEHSVRTAAPAVETVEPGGIWAYLDSRPAEAQVFGQAMTAKANADIASVLGSYDFSGFDTVADIGGGRGHLLAAVIDAAPSAQGVLFDLPDVINSDLTGKHDRLTPWRVRLLHPIPCPQPTSTCSWRYSTTGPIRSAERSSAPSDGPRLAEPRCSSSRTFSPTTNPTYAVTSSTSSMLATTRGEERTKPQLADLSTVQGSKASRESQLPARCASWRPQPPERPHLVPD
jgi:hypothetical protein